jgi:anthranilate synthase/aminodeoxychorismate synthase-like glutamine amidotransferase
MAAISVLIIDNYDSFTYNLVQEIGELGADPRVLRNDAADIADLKALSIDRLIISPGPGRPKDAGISAQAIRYFGEDRQIPVLGVCLGHQCIAEIYGAVIDYAPNLLHGKTSEIRHLDSPLFNGLPETFEATRYHSLIVTKESLKDPLKPSAFSQDDLIMAISHDSLPIYGVQFHPESVLTPKGPLILKNFLYNI